jgi:hypothetical protein
LRHSRGRIRRRRRRDDDAIKHGAFGGRRFTPPREVPSSGAQQHVERLLFRDVVEPECERHGRDAIGVHDDDVSLLAPRLKDLRRCGTVGNDRNPSAAYRELNGIGRHELGERHGDGQQPEKDPLHRDLPISHG